MIKLANVSKTYENGTQAIQDVSLDLPKTGFVAITGTSGCGKSTLINLMSGNDIVTAGSIEYEGKNYANISGDVLRKEFGYIYQDFKLIDNMTSYQNIMIGHELANDTFDYDSVIEIAKQLEIDSVLDEKVYSLSGGQQQRVAIARTLARNPKVIFADEPTGNLDSANTINVLNILRKLSADKLVVVVSHDKQIFDWADRIIEMSDGQIIGDVVNENANFVQPLEQAQNQEEDDIEEILSLQNKVKSKKVSKFFASGNKAKRGGKKSGLSVKSSLGLSIALLNKDVVKKVCLCVVMVILTAFMTLSCAMTFATVEKTMANAINSNEGQKIFAVSPTIESPSHVISSEDMQNFDRLLEESNLPYLEVGTGEVIAYGWSSLTKANTSKQIAYYAGMGFEKMCNAIFTDDPEKLGIEMLLGNVPKYNSEIAISKSYYDYLLYCGELEAEISGTTHKITLTKENILGKPILPFGTTICGVFDDKNVLDEDLKNLDITSLSAKEKEKILTNVNEEVKTNPLINLVIKCEGAKDDWKQFAGVASNTKMTLENCYGPHNKDYYFEFAPLNSATTGYYNLSSNISEIKLNKNEILIDNDTLDKINSFVKNNYSNSPVIVQGDEIPMCIVRMATFGGMDPFPDYTYVTENVTIAKVVDNLESASGVIFMNDQTYQTMKAVGKYSQKRLVCDEYVSASSLKKLNKGFVEYAKSLPDAVENNFVTYSIANCPMTQANDYGFIYICQQYLCIPMLVVSILATIAIIVVFYFDFIKTKAKDLLILKSLGAKTLDFIKIYGVFSLALIVILLVLGLALGSLLIVLFNVFASSLGSFASVFSVFYLDIASIFTAIALIVVINIVSLAISIASLGDKNLRKAFQKLKK